MLIVTEANTKAASAIPDIVACVIVHPACNGKGDSVEEHITCEVLIRLGGHYHHAHIGGLPGGEHHHVPVAVMEVDVVVTVAGCALRAANALDDAFK